MTSREELNVTLDRIKEIVAAVAGVDAREVGDNVALFDTPENLDNLGLDSLDGLSLSMHLADTYPHLDLESLSTWPGCTPLQIAELISRSHLTRPDNGEFQP